VTERFYPLSLCSVFLLQALAVTGCTTTTTQSHPDGTCTVSRRTADGCIIERRRFYIDSSGRKVLHGDSEFWPHPGRSGISKTYERGVLVREYLISAFQ
jgi:hypothetical protein